MKQKVKYDTVTKQVTLSADAFVAVEVGASLTLSAASIGKKYIVTASTTATSVTMSALTAGDAGAQVAFQVQGRSATLQFTVGEVVLRSAGDLVVYEWGGTSWGVVSHQLQDHYGCIQVNPTTINFSQFVSDIDIILVGGGQGGHGGRGGYGGYAGRRAPATTGAVGSAAAATGVYVQSTISAGKPGSVSRIKFALDGNSPDVSSSLICNPGTGGAGGAGGAGGTGGTPSSTVGVSTSGGASVDRVIGSDGTATTATLKTTSGGSISLSSAGGAIPQEIIALPIGEGAHSNIQAVSHTPFAIGNAGGTGGNASGATVGTGGIATTAGTPAASVQGSLNVRSSTATRFDNSFSAIFKSKTKTGILLALSCIGSPGGPGKRGASGGAGGVGASTATSTDGGGGGGGGGTSAGSAGMSGQAQAGSATLGGTGATGQAGQNGTDAMGFGMGGGRGGDGGSGGSGGGGGGTLNTGSKVNLGGAGGPGGAGGNGGLGGPGAVFLKISYRNF